MAITLDTIVNKVFKVVKNGYDNNEVESFLDEILEEMENREAETNKLKEQVAQLTADTRAAEIINKANQDAASIRSDAQTKIADLTAQLAALRKQTAEYYDSLKKITDAQTASMEQIKRLL